MKKHFWGFGVIATGIVVPATLAIGGCGKHGSLTAPGQEDVEFVKARIKVTIKSNEPYLTLDQFVKQSTQGVELDLANQNALGLAIIFPDDLLGTTITGKLVSATHEAGTHATYKLVITVTKYHFSDSIETSIIASDIVK